jgi:hypothetical protein
MQAMRWRGSPTHHYFRALVNEWELEQCLGFVPASVSIVLLSVSTVMGSPHAHGGINRRKAFIHQLAEALELSKYEIWQGRLAPPEGSI